MTPGCLSQAYHRRQPLFRPVAGELIEFLVYAPAEERVVYAVIERGAGGKEVGAAQGRASRFRIIGKAGLGAVRRA